MLLPSARTATFALRGSTRAPATGTRVEIDLKLIERAPSTPEGARGVVRAAMCSLSAAKEDARWLDRRSG
ncbi:hypothetical protein N9F40_00045 [bacterium]|nr:hypothetical protein [bacterium]